jgi:hypothetical protein
MLYSPSMNFLLVLNINITCYVYSWKMYSNVLFQNEGLLYTYIKLLVLASCKYELNCLLTGLPLE